MALFEHLPWNEIILATSAVGLAFSLWIGSRQARALRDLTNDRSWLLSLLSLSWDKPDRERELRSMAKAIGFKRKRTQPDVLPVARPGTRGSRTA